MQRRTVGKGQAHISLPKGSSSTMGGGDTEKTPRLNRRNFGVTNRIWIILSLVLSILILSRYIFGSSSSSSAGGHRLLSSDLKPKNYLNTTELQHRESPFAFCPVYGEGDEVGKKYGALALTKTRLHLGSGARIQRVVNKAMSGLPVTISVIGGSGMFSLVPPFHIFRPFKSTCGVVLLDTHRSSCPWVYVGRTLGRCFVGSSVLTDFVRHSIGLPWCWDGSFVTKLLPVEILSLVEHCLPTSGL